MAPQFQPLTLPLQIATLHQNGTLLGVPHNGEPILLEIGASDRDTMDVELLPLMPQAFLVSVEPILDKYSKGISRFFTPWPELFHPLGHQHPRGLLLPIAVGPVSQPVASSRFAMKPTTFNIGWTTGCSSVLNRTTSHRNGARFGRWCRHVAEQRQVPMVPLSQLLDWIGSPVTFAKIDAQGLDLQVVLSGGLSVGRRVHRVALEVTADDCVPIYEGQPNCSEVVRTMASLGYHPGGHLSCALPPSLGFPPGSEYRIGHSFCELDVLFESYAAPPISPAERQLLLSYHQVGPHGCVGTFGHNEHESLRYTRDSAVSAIRHEEHPDTAVAILNHPQGGAAFLSREWHGRSNRSLGHPYICPEACFAYRLPVEQQRAVHRNVSRFGGRCPWQGPSAR